MFCVFFFLNIISVILARIIRKSVRRINDNDVYKIEIKRSYKVISWHSQVHFSSIYAYDEWCVHFFLCLLFICSFSHELAQMSPKAHQQLRDGRLITPTMDSMCGGLNLKVGKLYLIAGNGAKIGICNYAKEYSQMTIVERRGFAGGYKKGCPCEVCALCDRNIIEYYLCILHIIYLFRFRYFLRSSRCSDSKVSITQLAPAIGNHSQSVKVISAHVYQLVVWWRPTANQLNAIGVKVHHMLRVSMKHPFRTADNEQLSKLMNPYRSSNN